MHNRLSVLRRSNIRHSFAINKQRHKLHYGGLRKPGPVAC
jgi:hypothetical protein